MINDSAPDETLKIVTDSPHGAFNFMVSVHESLKAPLKVKKNTGHSIYSCVFLVFFLALIRSECAIKRLT